MTDISKDVAELLKKVSTGKATVSEQMQLAKLLQEQAVQQQQDEKEEKFEKLREFAKSIDLSEELIIQAFQAPRVKMFECQINGTTYTRYAGQLGKCSFADELKKNFTEEQALKFVVQEPDTIKLKGEKFVKNIYSPKTA